MLVLLLLSAWTVRSYSQHVRSLKKSTSLELTCEAEDDTSEDDDEVHLVFTVPGNGTFFDRISPENGKQVFPVECSSSVTLVVDRWIRFCQFRLCGEPAC